LNSVFGRPRYTLRASIARRSISGAINASFILSLLCPGSGSCGADAVGRGDLHCNALFNLFENRSPGSPTPEDIQVSAPELAESKARIFFLSVCPPRFDLAEPDSVDIGEIVRFLGAFRRNSAIAMPEIRFAGDRSEAAAVLGQRRTAFAFALEGAHVLGNDFAWLDSLYSVGVRMIGIAHTFHDCFVVEGDRAASDDARADELMDPCLKYARAPSFITDESRLSEIGARLVNELIRLGITIDVSHLGEAAFWDVEAINGGRTPLVASHSNARAICDNPRNLTDDQMRAIAASGGVAGVCMHSPMLSNSTGPAGISDVIAHIQYMVSIMGADHVAIGTDFDGRILPPEGLASLGDLGKIARELKRRGMAETDIEKIMWRNAIKALPANGSAP
jgi:microsomal dipeptidase-like Zn-dependent dipeptidase